MRAFNTKTASIVTGASERQLRHWDRLGIVKPSIGQAAGRGSRRLYSFVDLVQARAAKQLRDDGLSLQRIRKALGILKEHPDKIKHPLAQLRLITDGESVFKLTDEQKVVADILRSNQRVHLWAILIKSLCDEVRAGLAPMVKRIDERVTVMGKSYEIRVEPDVVDGGFIAECSALPGCVTEGETQEEALRNIREAIADWLAAGQEQHLAQAQ